MALTLLIAGTPAVAVPIFNSGFEQPVAPASPGLVQAPTEAQQGAGASDSAWVFSAASGVARAGAAFGFTTLPVTPEGAQAGYVDSGGSFSQVIDFPVAGQYQLHFQEAGIGIYAVRLDTATLVASHLTPQSFAPVSATFTASAGAHTLTFQDTDPREIAGPLPVFIDAVSITPEPAAVGLLLGGVVMLCRSRRSFAR